MLAEICLTLGKELFGAYIARRLWRSNLLLLKQTGGLFGDINCRLALRCLGSNRLVCRLNSLRRKSEVDGMGEKAVCKLINAPLIASLAIITVRNMAVEVCREESARLQGIILRELQALCPSSDSAQCRAGEEENTYSETTKTVMLKLSRQSAQRRLRKSGGAEKKKSGVGGWW